MNAMDALLERDFDELVEHSSALMANTNKLRKALVDARKEAGLSQGDMAELLGVSQPTVSEFERHDNDLRLSTLRRYAYALGAMIDFQVTSRQGTISRSDGWTPIDVDKSRLDHSTQWVASPTSTPSGAPRSGIFLAA